MNNFPYDSEKGIEHYLERYYTEVQYRNWFQLNFGGSIEEALGPTRADNVIKEESSKCFSKALQYRQSWDQ